MSTADPPIDPTAPRPPGAAPAAGRVQPPLQEVLQGLDARELEGQTVFDQLFGPLHDPAGGPATSKPKPKATPR